MNKSMDKIVIIGSPGAGKSILARKLSGILKIEVCHLDRYFWQPGWKEYPRKTRLQIQRDLLRENDRWIIEGTYLGSSDDRLKAADTIIFLDVPWFICLWRVVKRHFERHEQPRLDIPDGCTDRLNLIRVLKVLVFPIKGRHQLLAKIKDIRAQEANQPKSKTILIYASTKNAEHFLQNLQTSLHKQPPCLCQEHVCGCTQELAHFMIPFLPKPKSAV